MIKGYKVDTFRNCFNHKKIKGYKVFKEGWTCKGYNYRGVGTTHKMDCKPKCCEVGFHFCKDLIQCFGYYDFSPKHKVAEILATGDIDTFKDKCCTNEITIVRELSWHEVLDLVNAGLGNTGYDNHGNCNSGNYNSGSFNSGNKNTGEYNSGSCNFGRRNVGDYNAGDNNAGRFNNGQYNTGKYNRGTGNTGDHNTGNYNSGDWNRGSFHSGVFCTEQNPHIKLFDHQSELTYIDWGWSKAHEILDRMPTDRIEFVECNEMTKTELANHPESEITTGFLRSTKPDSQQRQDWWNGLTEEERQEILNLPYFDAKKFFLCTGIRV